MIRTIKIIFISLVLLGFLSPLAVLAYYLSVYSYDITPLVEYKPQQTTRIYDRDGNKIANLFGEKHRYYASFSEIPPRAVEALVAIEDTAFFEHPGINIDAIFRAAIKVIKAGRAVEGASTITQQLVKNVLLTREKKLSRKIKEAIFALKLERKLSKEQILERYFNEIYFGHGYYGIKTAAEGYFRKELSELTLKEIAILVGLPKAPSSYAPTKNYEISMGRANRVLSRMHTLGWIDDATLQSSLAENPKVYDDTLTQNQAPFIVDEVRRVMYDLGYNDFETGGYKIYTTVDLKLQEAAKESLLYAYESSLKRIEKYKEQELKRQKWDPKFELSDINSSHLNGALVSIDAKNGDILALVGSVDYEKSSFNRATQSKRLPGSAFKPFIYQVALDLGYSGATKIPDISRTYTYEKDGEEMKWQPKNYEKDYKGLISIREALVHSRNLATINLVNEIGLGRLLRELDRFGIENLPRNLSISLGTIALSPLELAKYYTSFANNGMQVEPNLIKSIERNSEEIFRSEIVSKVVSQATQAYIMTTILKDVVERGTGRKARAKGIELAGKTGTTNSNVDGWFAGFSPTIQTVVWFGNDNNTPMYKRETGGRVAGPAFSKFYKRVLEVYPEIQRKFTKPEGIVEVVVDGEKEFFSDISKPPRREVTKDPQEQLLF